VPDETTGSSEVAHRATAGSHSAGQGNVESPPAVASDSNTGSDVVDGLFQSDKIEEGFCPKFVSMTGQSAVRDATTTVGIETPTGVSSGVSSRGRKNFVKPMGVAEFARGDSGKFSAPMGAQNYEGDLLSPVCATGSQGVSEQFSAPMGAREFSEVVRQEGSMAPMK